MNEKTTADREAIPAHSVLPETAKPTNPSANPSPRRLARDAAYQKETQEEKAARFERGRFKGELTLYLMPTLFGFMNPYFIGGDEMGGGRHVVARSGRVHTQKGYFGKNIETGREEVFRLPITGSPEGSREVRERMAGFGYSYRMDKPMDKPFQSTFYYPYQDGTPGDLLAFTYEDEEEAVSVCAAARLALQALNENEFSGPPYIPPAKQEKETDHE